MPLWVWIRHLHKVVVFVSNAGESEDHRTGSWEGKLYMR